MLPGRSTGGWIQVGRAERRQDDSRVGNWVTWVLCAYRTITGGADTEVPLERQQDTSKRNQKNLTLLPPCLPRHDGL